MAVETKPKQPKVALLDTQQPGRRVHASVAERVERGRRERERVPFELHAAWSPAAGRPDPVELILGQEETRVPDLLPIRHGRMLESPFSFYRGAAATMAADLATTPRTGLTVQLCGDAHLSNFGGFGSAERTLVFDLNDFDETLPGPWEWDLKRLATSVEVAGRQFGFLPKERAKAVRGAVKEYRRAMREFAAMPTLQMWYSFLSGDQLLQRWRGRIDRRLEKRLAKASSRTKDNMRALEKLTQQVDGRIEFVSNPPLVVPFTDIFSEAALEAFEGEVIHYVNRYAKSLSADRRHLLNQNHFVTAARKVVGVGSVGTRCYIMLFLGRDDQDPLILQVKEAAASVLEPYLGRSVYTEHGRRIVEGQSLIQASHDIFLGWNRITSVEDGVTRDFYLRQLWDWKVSAEVETMTASDLALYARMCGWTLAHAHARGGDRIAIASYVEDGKALDRAFEEFASAYADQNERDYAALATAVEEGRVSAQTGV